MLIIGSSTQSIRLVIQLRYRIGSHVRAEDQGGEHGSCRHFTAKKKIMIKPKGERKGNGKIGIERRVKEKKAIDRLGGTNGREKCHRKENSRKRIAEENGRQ